MHTFTHTEMHAEMHAARTAELATEAAAWRLAHEAAPVAPVTPALRNLLGEALVAAGIRLMQPAHVHARVQRAV
ncbi:hypothetical protein [Streptomyces sp. ISL-86]|uniref:hypothetical protein n=1 Tax=Streptomyces sp. ISL-86 TaxID=2819187 RepID=UPI001BEB1740|nr:hypothetical protein [Streptomyces sp. ISL-86]MBT2458258.1 hypothetical protein [Streptomyces sp. ISL-86]